MAVAGALAALAGGSLIADACCSTTTTTNPFAAAAGGCHTAVHVKQGGVEAGTSASVTACQC